MGIQAQTAVPRCKQWPVTPVPALPEPAMKMVWDMQAAEPTLLAQEPEPATAANEPLR